MSQARDRTWARGRINAGAGGGELGHSASAGARGELPRAGSTPARGELSSATGSSTPAWGPLAPWPAQLTVRGLRPGLPQGCLRPARRLLGPARRRRPRAGSTPVVGPPPRRRRGEGGGGSGRLEPPRVAASGDAAGLDLAVPLLPWQRESAKSNPPLHSQPCCGLRRVGSCVPGSVHVRRAGQVRTAPLPLSQRRRRGGAMQSRPATWAGSSPAASSRLDASNGMDG